jgi:hypothetical protein
MPYFLDRSRSQTFWYKVQTRAYKRTIVPDVSAFRAFQAFVDIFFPSESASHDYAPRETRRAMNPKVMALRKSGARYDSGTDLVRKTLSASASGSGLSQIVQVRAISLVAFSACANARVSQSKTKTKATH